MLLFSKNWTLKQMENQPPKRYRYGAFEGQAIQWQAGQQDCPFDGVTVIDGGPYDGYASFKDSLATSMAGPSDWIVLLDSGELASMTNDVFRCCYVEITDE